MIKDTIPEQSEKPKIDWNFVRFRFFVALLSGMTAIVVSYGNFFFFSKNAPWMRAEQIITQCRMDRLRIEIEHNKDENGIFLPTLPERSDMWDVYDGWKNLLIYTTDGKSWSLISYGADGKPGGIGLDTDYVSSYFSTRSDDRKTYKNSQPTLPQMFVRSFWLFRLAFIIGCFCGLLTLARLFDKDFSKEPKRRLLLSWIVCWAFFSALISFVLVILMLGLASLGDYF